MTYNFCMRATRHVKVALMSAGEAVVNTRWFLSCNLAAKTAPPGSASETIDTASGRLSSGSTRVSCSTRAFLGWIYEQIYHKNQNFSLFISFTSELLRSVAGFRSTLRLCFFDLLLPGVDPRSLLNNLLLLSAPSFLCSNLGGEPAICVGVSFASWSVQFSGCESLSARLELSSLSLSTPRSVIFM